MTINTQADNLIKGLKNVFSRYGLCDDIVSDNGSLYKSDVLDKFLKVNVIKHSYTPLYNPATNGAAENYVNTFKDKVNKIIKYGKSLNDAIDLFLFDYRSTVHCTTGRSPARLMFKRELRTQFDLLKPDVLPTVEQKQ